MSKSSPLTIPGLASFLKSVKHQPVESSIEHLISLLKRRQIRNSRPCAIATANLLRRVVASFRVTDFNQLIERVQQVGQRLTAAQPREIAVGNIVRRVLGLIREEVELNRDGENSDADSRPQTPQNQSPRPGFSSIISTQSPLRLNVDSDGATLSRHLPESSNPTEPESFHRPPLLGSHTSSAASNAAPMVTSMFSLLSHPLPTSNMSSPSPTLGTQSPVHRNSLTPLPLTPHAVSSLAIAKDLRAEIIEGIEEIIDELDQVDDQIAAYALEHIHSNEIILTHGSSSTVQKFLLKAAAKRKFTIIHAESFPNNHEATHTTVIGRPDSGTGDEMSSEVFSKPLIAAGITVILIPDAAVFALMSRVNKVILGTHVVLANGGLVAQAGAKTIAKAARVHRTPVVVVTGVYKLSPIYPFDFDALIEYGDASKVLCYEDGDLVDKVDVENPLFDYVPAELVDLYITNLGGHAPSYLYRIVSDHYRTEDTNLAKLD